MNTILVVDDSRDVVDIFVKMLEKGWYGTFAAHGGEECLEILKEVAPDLILLDIMMEPMDGWETLEKIKNNVATVPIPVLILTSKQLTPAEMEKYGDDIEDYVLKPVTDFEMYTAIEHVFHRRQTIRSEVDRAMKRGVDSGVVNEYALLLRSVDINKQFLNIFETRYNLNNSNIHSSDNICQALKKLDATIRVQKTRLQEIEGKIRIP
ncbi:MAG: response regulator [Methanoregula sp.]